MYHDTDKLDDAVQDPYVGADVYYKTRGSADGVFAPENHAAKITRVHGDGVVDLIVFNPTGLYFSLNVKYGTEPGQWSCPLKN